MLDSRKCIALFEKYGVLSQRELHSRYDIYLEQYCKTVTLEAKLTLEMAKTMIFPAAVRYQNELASTCANLKLVGYDVRHRHARQDHRAGEVAAGQHRRPREGAGRSQRRTSLAGRSQALSATTCCPAMLAVRKYADELEGWVADDLWPLPTYQEMLFIK